MQRQAQTSSHQKKRMIRLLTGLVLFVIIFGGATALMVWLRYGTLPPHQSESSSKTVAPQRDKNVHTQSPAPSPIQQQSGTDLHGQSPSSSSTDPSNWITSTSGAITVKSPTANSLFTSNDTLFGSATVTQIHYRLIDDTVGVISQGTADVVNGSFSVSVNFQPYSKTGRLDVFSTDSRGRELNEVEISITF